MVDPIVLAAPQAAQATPQAHAGAAAAPKLDPGETRMFAHLMQGVSAPPTSVSATGTLHDAAMAVAAQFGGQTRSYEDMRRSMLESIDMSDPIRTMLVLTDHSMQANTMFAKLHIATGLASAATSLFGSLLKNQQ